MRLIFLARKAPTAEELDADAEHLARAASVTAAMADLLDAYAPDKKVGNKDPKDWKRWTGEMRAAAEELEGAARAKDAKGLKAAAVRVTASCNECHSVFRD
jgi:cytochrome c556